MERMERARGPGARVWRPQTPALPRRRTCALRQPPSGADDGRAAEEGVPLVGAQQAAAQQASGVIAAPAWRRHGLWVGVRTELTGRVRCHEMLLAVATSNATAHGWLRPRIALFAIGCPCGSCHGQRSNPARGRASTDSKGATDGRAQSRLWVEAPLVIMHAPQLSAFDLPASPGAGMRRSSATFESRPQATAAVGVACVLTAIVLRNRSAAASRCPKWVDGRSRASSRRSSSRPLGRTKQSNR